MPRMPNAMNRLPVIIGLLVAAIAGLAWAANSDTFANLPFMKQPLDFIFGEKNMSVVEEKVLHANESNFPSLVLQSQVPVLVDFYADWCGPCQRIAPVLEQLAVELPHAKIVKVNVDHNPNLASKYGVDSIPNLILFKNGKAVDQLVGLASKSQLKSLLEGE